MDKIIFKITETNSSWLQATEEKYLLLDYFLSSYQFASDIAEAVVVLNSIASGEKTFEEAFDPELIWNFGVDGEFECDQQTAYFASDSEPELNLQMPIQEVIDYLLKWQEFMVSE